MNALSDTNNATSSLERISFLINKQDFAFQSWNDRYGKGVWAALGTYLYQVDVVRDLSDAGDMEMMWSWDYVFSSDWLPYATGKSLMEAMLNLEERLSKLPHDQLERGSNWCNKVTAAIDELSQANRENRLERLAPLF
jgi:hypothetical protein